ncbi:MAG: hypothetical protein RDU24_11885 [Humidesulfovibrio sp.]|uniref:hypothetical protein n=1 Tax=Humidesulfovibrio sp. TaxID=2910988 RepID=UPI0027F9AF79|nr:hypothetical protein [Humidesulfovibrio sp.]MDQ7836074.1 hypothetical protein [Humidesulfovibrio sp.]
MAANKEPIFIGQITGKITELADTTETDIFVGDAEESTRVDVLAVSTDDTADKDLVLYFHDGTASKKATTVKIPLSSGSTNTIAPVNLLAASQMAPFVQADASGNKYINLPPNHKLRAAEAAAPTAGKKMWVFARGGKY